MRWLLIGLAVLLVVLVVGVVAAIQFRNRIVFDVLAPSPSLEERYPTAPQMPAIVSTAVEDLLAAHEAFLKSNVPAAYAALQPGLTDAEIDQLEAKHSIKLSSDLRALYRWRNGTPRASNVDAFPNHEFFPLDVALTDRDLLRQQVLAASPDQQKAYARLAGHRDAWVGMIVDLAGDGHFFDPGRTEPQGSFFFCFAEDGEYIFYPAFRNYLAAVVDGEKSGVFIGGPRGVDTTDFGKAQDLWTHYGAAARR